MNKKIEIAVTGVGGGEGQSVIKSFDQTDYEVVGWLVTTEKEIYNLGVYRNI